eukprot:CAMPEP_0172526940 /NCGR_PEP_ID=MMETSP1067-20121228/1756_1 /TAXON_ID=265564 ORGANISM="Thalassiosira punctigera, Strain Tpunct2005C2" /NCGR_SAMPLE_ID=MMETSP1067 /ASSEMBLY_ACC=CAM_ASM_000444 /LENGTH=181 /DNA_ID=CAMNT_0013310579 /DNA_START=18 /DNA_END=563 /DNA_ORIENTATION=+
MTSAALPPLPSIRAKELERDSHENESINDGSWNFVVATAEAPSGPKKEQSASSITDLRPSASSSAPYQSEDQRSEQLAALHQKEKKVFSGLPPLESNVACNAIHQYISTTSSFLNSFIADANASHEGIDHKLTVLEKQMALLESKIASIPDLLPEEEENGEEIKDEEKEGEPNQEGDEGET